MIKHFFDILILVVDDSADAFEIESAIYAEVLKRSGGDFEQSSNLGRFEPLGSLILFPTVFDFVEQ